MGQRVEVIDGWDVLEGACLLCEAGHVVQAFLLVQSFRGCVCQQRRVRCVALVLVERALLDYGCTAGATPNQTLTSEPSTHTMHLMFLTAMPRTAKYAVVS